MPSTLSTFERVTPAGVAEPTVVPAPRATWIRVGGWVVGAWVCVIVAHVAQLTVLVPPVLLMAVAGLLRGGRTLLDRLMLATALLLGLTCLAGLVFAMWPWGLHPVAVAGTAFTALIVTAAALRRRPAFPRPTLVDALSLGAVALLTAYLVRPMLRDGQTGRLAVMMAGEDLGRHATIFDAIRHTGGYLFQRWDAAAELVYPGMITYPQGSHLLAALLDGFVRSSGADTGASMLDHYLALVIGGYVLMSLTMIWAAQWIGAGELTLTRRLPLIGFVAAICGASELLGLLAYGYPSQVVGVAEATLLIALLIRPVTRVRQQMVLVAGLLVAVGFTYYLFLPPVGLATLIWLFRDRRRLLRHRVTLTLSVAAGVVAWVPMGLGLTVADQAESLLAAGQPTVSRDGLIALGCIVAAGVLTRRGRHSRIWRSYVWTFLPVAAFVVALFAVVRLYGTNNGYYPNKALYLVLVVLTVGIGAVALHLPAPAGRKRPEFRQALPAALVLSAIAATYGLPHGDSPYRPVARTNWGRMWASGAPSDAQARIVLRAYHRYEGQPAVPVFVVGDDAGYESYSMTLFLAAMQRTAGATAPAIYNGQPVTHPDRLDSLVQATARPMRLLALSDNAERRARLVRDRYPDSQIMVDRLR